jgi:hypothetical protein
MMALPRLSCAHQQCSAEPCVHTCARFPFRAARMAPFTCQAACEDKWRRRGPSRREDPLAGCDALPDDAKRPGGRDWALVAPPPLTPAQADAARALWRTLDGAFVVRLLRCGCAPELS